MGRPPDDWTAVDGDREAKPGAAEASAVDLADLLLAAATRRRSISIGVRPEAGGYVVSLGDGHGDALALADRLGESLAVRLGILAGIDPWAGGPHFGPLRLRVGTVAADFLVEVDRSALGLAAEVRRIADSADLEAARALQNPTEPLHKVGAYTVLGELGRGGMGVVYLARHEETGRRVAIKVLHRELAADPRLASQFVREGRAASLANHPGIVNVTDFGRLPSGPAYLVMELVEAATLEVVLAEGALGDFGAAKVMSPMPDSTATQHGVVLGTPFYMSPEQARGLPTDERTDFYALGCILFRMIAGRPPYEGETVMDIVSGHLTRPLPLLESPSGPVPEAVASLVAKTLAKRAEDRPQTASEMGADLDRALASFPPEAPA